MGSYEELYMRLIGLTQLSGDGWLFVSRQQICCIRPFHLYMCCGKQLNDIGKHGFITQQTHPLKTWHLRSVAKGCCLDHVFGWWRSSTVPPLGQASRPHVFF